MRAVLDGSSGRHEWLLEEAGKPCARRFDTLPDGKPLMALPAVNDYRLAAFDS